MQLEDTVVVVSETVSPNGRRVTVYESTVVPTVASIRRVEAALVDAPAGWLRPGITPESVATDILAESRVQPSRMPKEDFDCLLADFAYLSCDDVDDIRDAHWTVGGEPA